MLSSYSFPVIVTSSVFLYIEKTAPKINEHQQLYSESILNIYHVHLMHPHFNCGSMIFEECDDYGGPRREFLSLYLTEAKSLLVDEGTGSLKETIGYIDDEAYYALGIVMGE